MSKRSITASTSVLAATALSSLCVFATGAAQPASAQAVPAPAVHGVIVGRRIDSSKRALAADGGRYVIEVARATVADEVWVSVPRAVYANAFLGKRY